jgi:hypothetical protein
MPSRRRSIKCKKIGDIRQMLPDGVIGPFFNDEFGDTYFVTPSQVRASRIRSLRPSQNARDILLAFPASQKST